MAKKQSTTYERELKKLRDEINKQDRILLATMKNRFKIVKKVALLKKKYKLPILQKSRWKTIIEDRVVLGEKLGLAPKFTTALMNLIHKESIRIQLSLQSTKDKK
jgi:chorismate mutase